MNNINNLTSAEQVNSPDEENLPELTKSDALKRDIYDIVQVLVHSVIAIAIIFIFVFRVTGVEGSSMRPTLSNSDWLVISSLNFEPQRGDIVVLSRSNVTNKPLVKRIIAVAGDVVDIDDDGIVVVNGEKLDEPYTAAQIHPSRRGTLNYPHTVAQGCIFVMGDNRNASTDSRIKEVGDIDSREVVGKVLFRAYPFGKVKVY